MTAPGAPPATVRVFIAGNSGSGKTTRARSLYLDRMPRRILCDLTGEHETWPGAVTAWDVDELHQALASVRRRAEWTVRLVVDPADFGAVVRYLVPVPDLTRSPVRVLGGAVMLVDEVDLLAPPRSASTEVRTLYRRSRHVGLSVVSTTQRPANVSREVSAQSTHALALRLSEPRDVAYMADLMRWGPDQVAGWRRWTVAHPHGGVFRDLGTGRTLYLPDRGPPQDRGMPGDQRELLEQTPEG